MSAVEWAEPPPAETRGTREKASYRELADALRAAPGKWAKLPDGPHSATQASNVRSGKIASFRGGFEATFRKHAGTDRGDVYVRYVGGES